MSLLHFVPKSIVRKKKKKYDCQSNNILKMLLLEGPILLSLSELWKLGEEDNEIINEAGVKGLNFLKLSLWEVPV